MPVEVATDESEAQDVDVEEIPVSEGERGREADRRGGNERRHKSQKRSKTVHVDVEIEREVTRRRLIESVTSIVLVVLYMIFTLMRERDAGVVILDDEGPEDDWKE